MNGQIYILAKTCTSFHLFYYLWAKRNVLVSWTSREKALLIQIKILLVPNNQTVVLLQPEVIDIKDVNKA